MRYLLTALTLFPLMILGAIHPTNAEEVELKYVILMVGDGMGMNQLQAANLYTGTKPEYQNWTERWVSTYSIGDDYDPQQFWSNFDYPLSDYTDSAAAATALSSGVKTANGRISVSADGGQRLTTIADLARDTSRAVGVVTSVYISHATPGAWYAHNSDRSNGYAIADEGLWGNPNTTGDPSQPYYGGGYGPNYPPLDVIIGAGHPDWKGGNYFNSTMLSKIKLEAETQPHFAMIERIDDSPDAGSRLLNAANDPTIHRLVGLFGGKGGNLEYRLADGSGHDPENPTLFEMTAAALIVLSRDPDGFVLMVEGGAIDWAGHQNDMNRAVGEQIGFNQSVETVIDWVENPTNNSSWANTLVVVTADHETGFLTAGPGEFPDQPIGPIDNHSLSLEKEYSNSGHRASWEDSDGDANIDPGEYVYWAWNSTGHSNSLVPLFAKGVGAENFPSHYQGTDPIRGNYVDNTAINEVILEMMLRQLEPTPRPTELPNQNRFFIPFVYR